MAATTDRGCKRKAARTALYLAAMIPWLATGLAGCSGPARRADSLAEHLGFRKSLVEGNGFRHVIYENLKAVHDGALHVYIDGDGTPYVHVTAPATDPTPRNLVMLRLMALDPIDSVYVGRPCYFEVRDSACDPALWTTARYGPRVLASMEVVVRREMIGHAAGRIEIFGLSGGGTLAVLLAQRIDAVDRIVTLGANLDIDAWCDLHHYSHLVGSLNPSQQPPLRASVDVLHLVGALDTNTPPDLVRAAAEKRGEHIRVVDHVDHGCCWEALWPSVLDDSHNH